MKRSFKAALVLVCIVFAGNIAKAQVKIGYVNISVLVQAMPDTKNIQEQVNAYSKQFLDQLTTMNTDFQAKAKTYESKKATMTDAARTAAEGELSDMQKRMQEYSNNSQQQVEAKSNELAKPLFE